MFVVNDGDGVLGGGEYHSFALRRDSYQPTPCRVGDEVLWALHFREHFFYRPI